jgi:hypothetical protein
MSCVSKKKEEGWCTLDKCRTIKMCEVYETIHIKGNFLVVVLVRLVADHKSTSVVQKLLFLSTCQLLPFVLRYWINGRQLGVGDKVGEEGISMLISDF